MEAVLADGARYTIGEIRGTTPEQVGGMTVLVCGWPREEGPQSLLGQHAPVQRVLVADRRRNPSQPGCIRIQNLSQVCDDPTGLLWICSGHEGVADDFLVRAREALETNPMASFTVAVELDAAPQSDLPSVLGGAGLGVAIVFRTAAIATIGGLDEGADGAEALQWDLAIRLAQGGHSWIHVPAAHAGAAGIVMRASEEAIRWLYRKHARRYREHLREILLEREQTIGALLAANHLAERALEERLRPIRTARRRERDRLGAKLRVGSPAEDVRLRDRTEWGDLRRFEPFSPSWGSERGLCVDRYYIEDFLGRHASDVRGVVLDYGSDTYARRYGGAELSQVDVLETQPGNPQANLVSDLCDPSVLEAERYDCIVLAQALAYVRDPEAALAACNRMLKPGGVLLATVTSVGRINPESPDQDRWRFSEDGLRQLLDSAFGAGQVEIRADGGRHAAAGLLLGLSTADVGESVLAVHDPQASLVTTARAVKLVLPDGD
jgi:hypothetical protein